MPDRNRRLGEAHGVTAHPGSSAAQRAADADGGDRQRRSGGAAVPVWASPSRGGGVAFACKSGTG